MPIAFRPPHCRSRVLPLCLMIAGVSLHHGGACGSERRRPLRMLGEGPPVCVKERASAGDWKSSRGMVVHVRVKALCECCCSPFARYRPGARNQTKSGSVQLILIVLHAHLLHRHSTAACQWSVACIYPRRPRWERTPLTLH